MTWKLITAIVLAVVWQIFRLISLDIVPPPGLPVWIGPLVGLVFSGLLAWEFLPRYRIRREALPARLGAALTLLAALATFLCALFAQAFYLNGAFLWLALLYILGMLPAAVIELRRTVNKKKKIKFLVPKRASRDIYK